jgi:hypothetical protein
MIPKCVWKRYLNGNMEDDAEFQSCSQDASLVLLALLLLTLFSVISPQRHRAQKLLRDTMHLSLSLAAGKLLLYSIRKLNLFL